MSKQYGGRLDCGLTENAPSILLLGHSCEYMGRTLQVPANWVYVTSSVCGNPTYSNPVFLNFIKDFFQNKPFFKMPCNQYELSKQYSNDEEILNFHYKNAPHMSNKSYQEIYFSPLSSFFRNENNYSVKMANPKIYYWYASKSGIYINNNQNNSTYSNSVVVSLIKNKDNKRKHYYNL